ncbi:MAG: UDP-glucose 4-epimerase GalE [Actinomycetota bacterium]|nr:MAG: UDP-glucose 4-epimerase GalE [Actinomycetota bacterium]
MSWVVTGGAGYIGSHVARALLADGRDVVVLDDLSTGRLAFVPEGVRVVEGSITDPAALRAALGSGDVDGVVHLAGFKYAGVSVSTPFACYHANVEGTRLLLEAMATAGVDRIVFSSSAATYGTPDVDLVTEATPTRPESPYGESKLIGEWLVRDAARARELAGGTPLRHVSLRYFNVVGSGDPAVFDVSPHNLFPLVMKAVDDGREPTIHGDDYPTEDGTCVRDYIHVADVASAHVAAARVLEAGSAPSPVYCLGRGEGTSVKQILSAVRSVTGVPFQWSVGPRRPGDPARIVCSPAAAQRDLDWAAEHDLTSMVATAWSAWQQAKSVGAAALA